MINNLEKTKQFLWLLFGRYFKQIGNEQLIEFRFIHFSGKAFSKFSRLHTIGEFLSSEKRRVKSQNGYNVYFGVNPRGPEFKKTQKDITDVVCIWLDIDAKNFNAFLPIWFVCHYSC